MSNSNVRLSLKSISEVVAEIHTETEKDILESAARSRRYAAERIKEIELNRQAIALLDAAGIGFNSNSTGSYCRITLGYFSDSKSGNSKLAKVVRRIREALGCRLEQTDKDVSDAKKKRVQVVLTPTLFPSVNVRFERRLPKSAKCKIVRHVSRYSSLVCEM